MDFEWQKGHTRIVCEYVGYFSSVFQLTEYRILSKDLIIAFFFYFIDLSRSLDVLCSNIVLFMYDINCIYNFFLEEIDLERIIMSYILLYILFVILYLIEKINV